MRHWSSLAGGRLRDHLVACVGAAFAIAVTGLLTFWAVRDTPGLAVLVAPMGASAVLLFALPSGPLSQPWPAIGGNVLSCLVGIAVARTFGHGPLAGGLAVGAAIAVMAVLRCLHPPGGAAALTAVIGGQAVAAAGYGFALVPVGVNAIAMVIAAWAFHGMTGRKYPHRATPPPVPDDRVQDDAIDAALAELDEPIDIDRETLRAVLIRAQAIANGHIAK